jgi:Tol biopolymer transport system component
MGMVSWPNAEDRFLWQGMRGEQAAFDINLTTNLGTEKSIRTQRLSIDGKFPALSPDGSSIAYFCGNYSRLCMITWPSKQLQFELPISYFKTIDDKPVNATAAWASDGAWVYFSSSITGNWDIYRMRPDGSQMQNLTESSTADEILPTAR